MSDDDPARTADRPHNDASVPQFDLSTFLDRRRHGNADVRFDTKTITGSAFYPLAPRYYATEMAAKVFGYLFDPGV